MLHWADWFSQLPKGETYSVYCTSSHDSRAAFSYKALNRVRERPYPHESATLIIPPLKTPVITIKVFFNSEFWHKGSDSWVKKKLYRFSFSYQNFERLWVSRTSWMMEHFSWNAIMQTFSQLGCECSFFSIHGNYFYRQLTVLFF